MNILMALALGVIAAGVFGLVGLLVYAQLQVNRPSVKRPSVKRSKRNADLVVVHRVGRRKKRRVMRPAAPAPAMDAVPDGDSRWRRPGFAAVPSASNEREPLPYYEPDKPRHVFIAHTPSVIIPHQTVEAPKPRLSQRTQRSQPTAMIKTIRVETQKPA